MQVSRAILERHRTIRLHQDFLLNRHLKVTVTEAPALTEKALELSDVDFGVNIAEICPELLPAAILSTIQTDGSITGLAATSDDLIVVVSFCRQKLSIYKRTGQCSLSLSLSLSVLSLIHI